jgi:hypothetical protein
MSVITTLDITDMTPEEYRAVLDQMGVETRPAGGIYLHLTTAMSFGYRVIELWDRKEGFEEFLEQRLAPATQELGIDRETEITVTPLHNLFAPRLEEIPGLVASLPGAPRRPGPGPTARSLHR